MRAILVAFVMLLAAMPLAAPGAAAEPTKLLEDPAGDVTVRHTSASALPSVALPVGWEHSDLRALFVGETPDELSFILQLEGFERPVGFANYRIHFTWSDEEYYVSLWRSRFDVLAGEFSGGALYRDRNGFGAVAELEVALDPSAGTLATSLPRGYLLDRDGHFPLKDDVLENLYVLAQSRITTIEGQGVSIEDRMPDDGHASFVFETGASATGHVRVYATEPVRVSNGGSTTIVFMIDVHNEGDVDDEMTLSLRDLPSGWDVSVQSSVRVPAGGERIVPVLATLPFAHDHGGLSQFDVVATSKRDSSASASARLGVLHTPIPQPAGHHADLFLHARNYNAGAIGIVFPFMETTMNTLADHVNDEEYANINDFQNAGPGWSIALAPGLQMGLDFDLDRPARLVGEIHGHGKVESRLQARLLLVTPSGEPVLLAESDPEPISLDLNEHTPFELTFAPLAAADYIAYKAGQNLELQLHFSNWDDLSLCCAPWYQPRLHVESFRLSLPLNEYHDRLTGSSEGTGPVRLTPDGTVEKGGRPGSMVTYAFTLTNNAETEETFVLDTAGAAADAGSIVPAGEVRLKPGESRRVTLGVTIPINANDGQPFEVILFARAQSDPSLMSLVRTKSVAVTTGEATPDEREEFLAAANAERETPMGGATLVLGAMAGAAFIGSWKRRQRP